MQGTRLKSVLRESIGNIWRETRIALTPVPKPEKWLFVVGCYNSGTTLLAKLLAQHPDISGMPTEGHFITDQFVKDYQIGLPRMWVDREDLFRLDENDQGPDVIRLKKEWGMRLNRSKPVLLEKSPPNTARTLWLQENFENAYFIAIVRNGYAVAEGISRKADPKHLKEGWPIEKAAWQWARSNQVLREDAQKLKHIIWITYEELASDPQATLNKLSGFLGISSFPESVSGTEFAVHERQGRVTDLNQVSISNLTPEQFDKINQVAGEEIERFGYPLIVPDSKPDSLRNESA
ncbi:sulfotransferase family protein [Marinobacter sp. SS21]|uniref:sulfotransferase family protein n=1 Tax=Marinobacter sp. SS21 TaxID=2979460 RepID=UPI00232F780E|nr:sulfotransferase [Marinobacter sp. SS21]MDC0661942.1 sulfotransferase [Marinobacter sp. SS21]